MRKFLGRRAAATVLVGAAVTGVVLPATACVPRKYCYGSYAAMRCYPSPRHA